MSSPIDIPARKRIATSNGTEDGPEDICRRFKITVALGGENVDGRTSFWTFMTDRLRKKIRSRECVDLLTKSNCITVKTKIADETRCEVCLKRCDGTDAQVTIYTPFEHMSFSCHAQCGDRCELAYQMLSKLARLEETQNKTLASNFSYFMSALDTFNA